MRKQFTWILTVVVALAAFVAVAGDINGAWKASMPGRDGQTMEMVFKFKAEGATLTGTVSSPMGGDTAISDGKISGDSVTFNVKREFNGQTMIMKYEGTMAGDEIKFKSTREGSDRPPREFTAKRATQS